MVKQGDQLGPFQATIFGLDMKTDTPIGHVMVEPDNHNSSLVRKVKYTAIVRWGQRKFLILETT